MAGAKAEALAIIESKATETFMVLCVNVFTWSEIKSRGNSQTNAKLNIATTGGRSVDKQTVLKNSIEYINW